MKNYYQMLNIPESATQSQVTAAYRGLARMYHPDVNKTPEAGEKMRAINEAYEILRNPEKRQKYDLERQGKHVSTSPFSNYSNADLNELLRKMQQDLERQSAAWEKMRNQTGYRPPAQPTYRTPPAPRRKLTRDQIVLRFFLILFVFLLMGTCYVASLLNQTAAAF